MTLKPLSARQLDALREVSNIGMGHAATALSQLIGETVELHVPCISVAEIVRIPALLGRAEDLFAGITLQIFGEARGIILLLFPQQSAQQLLIRLLGRPADEPICDELSSSTLKEIGNILASAYLSALGNLLHMSLIPSIPLLAYDMLGAVADRVLIELSREEDLALLVETEFHGRAPTEEVIRGHFLILPDADTLDVIFDAANVGYEK
ncbi:MAG: chemotaxis protein CheC [Desulfuromonadaceae bacterium]|jgi:chemotaxis protein CheC